MFLTANTQRASLSLKSIPSATFALKTAKKIAPHAVRYDSDDDSSITLRYALMTGFKSFSFFGSTKIVFNLESLSHMPLFFHLLCMVFIAL